MLHWGCLAAAQGMQQKERPAAVTAVQQQVLSAAALSMQKWD